MRVERVVCPDVNVEVETVFVGASSPARLRARGSKLRGVQRIGPRLNRNRFPETQFVQRRLGVGDAKELVNVAVQNNGHATRDVTQRSAHRDASDLPVTARCEHADAEEKSQADEEGHDGEGQGHYLTQRFQLSMVVSLVLLGFLSEIKYDKVNRL